MTRDWTDGYLAALRDVSILARSRDLRTAPLDQLIADLEGDAFVIEHEQNNRMQRRRLTAAREALPLFAPLGRDST